MARQKHRNLELILVLHGLSEDADVVRDKALAAGIPAVKVLHAPPHFTLGEVLNHGILQAEGELISKMDDDNLYGPNYLWDLVRVFDYADAELTGKGAHYTYFPDTNTTVYRLPGLENRYTHPGPGRDHPGQGPTCSAPTPSRPSTRARTPRLVRRLKEDGVRIYSADRFNFVYMRGSDASQHTWQAADYKLTRNAVFSFVGHPDEHVMI